MINLTDKSKCNGCCACVDICPHNAISLKTDIEGFWYPELNSDLCKSCGLCEKTCPELHIQDLRKNDFLEPISYAAVHNNLKVRWDSTSGGIFSALAEAMYNENGYVSGAIYDEDFLVRNFISNNPDDLPGLRSSKYLQSKAEGIYSEIKDLLINGKKVLACGTPCQMAALRRFIGKDYNNLIIVDLVCRGVNSPKVYRKYLDSLENRFNSKIVYIKAKNKELGWRNLTRKVVFENGQAYYGIRMEDDFRRGYHTNVYCRPSCYNCQYKGFPRMADITLADCWGIEKINKNLDNNIGTSLILINSEKGEKYFEKIKSYIEFVKVPFSAILQGNPALNTSLSPSKINREKFFEYLDVSSFDETVQKYFPLKSTSNSWKQRVKEFLKSGYRMYRYLGVNPKSYFQFFSLNFLRKNTCRDQKNKQLIYPTRYSVFNIHPNAKININKDIVFGLKTIKGSKLESRLKMEANTSLTITDGPETRYGKGVYVLRYGCDIQIVNEGELTIGQGACNMNLNIMCAKKITIGNGVRIGRDVTIRDWNGSHVIVSDTYRNHEPVFIGDHVWIASGVTIMPGVTIGEGTVIAANTVVTKSVPPKCLVAGIPGRVVRQNIEWY